MTTIKPPAGPGASPTAAHMPEPSPQSDPTGSLAETTETAASTARAATPSQHVQPHVSTASAPGSGAAGATGPVGGLQLGSDAAGTLAAAVERGQLSMAQAIDQLVDRTVDGMAEHLSEAERLELSEVLQLALTSDPTFSAMRGEQG